MPPASAEAIIDNEHGGGRFVLVCEHASRNVPAHLDDLGLAQAELQSHIAWDIGALDVARALSARVDAPLVHPAVSRLVVDVNRSLDSSTLIVEESDGIPIPGNRELDDDQRAGRLELFYHPFHRALAALLDRACSKQRRPIVVSVHSFNRVVRGRTRAWDLGVIFDSSSVLAQTLLDDPTLGALGSLAPNEPYSPADGVFFTLSTHAETRGLDALMLEICNDRLVGPGDCSRWADALAAALGRLPGSAGKQSMRRPDRPANENKERTQ